MRIKSLFDSFQGKLKDLSQKVSYGIPTVRFHPLFIAYAILLVLCGAWKTLICTVFAVIVHEMGHSAEALRHGYKLEKIVLMPYGGVIDGDNIDNHVVSVSLAGPLTNLLFALVLFVLDTVLAHGGIIQDMINANIALFSFNLLPAYPLDGAKIVISLCKNKVKAIKILRNVGIIFSFLLVFGFIWTCFYAPDYPLAVMAIFLFVGSTRGLNNEIINHLVGLSPLIKNYTDGVELRQVVINENAPVYKLNSMLKHGTSTTFFIVDNDNKRRAIIDESDAVFLLTNFSRNKSIKDCLALVANVEKKRIMTDNP